MVTPEEKGSKRISFLRLIGQAAIVAGREGNTPVLRQKPWRTGPLLKNRKSRSLVILILWL